MQARLIATSYTRGPRQAPYNLYASISEDTTRYDWATDANHKRERFCRFLCIMDAIRDAELVLER